MSSGVAVPCMVSSFAVPSQEPPEQSMDLLANATPLLSRMARPASTSQATTPLILTLPPSILTLPPFARFHRRTVSSLPNEREMFRMSITIAPAGGDVGDSPTGASGRRSGSTALTSAIEPLLSNPPHITGGEVVAHTAE